MERIIKRDGYVFLVKDWERKGFETYHNLGKDPNHPMWHEEIEEMKKTKKNKKEKED